MALATTTVLATVRSAIGASGWVMPKTAAKLFSGLSATLFGLASLGCLALSGKAISEARRSRQPY